MLMNEIILQKSRKIIYAKPHWSQIVRYIAEKTEKEIWIPKISVDTLDQDLFCSWHAPNPQLNFIN